MLRANLELVASGLVTYTFGNVSGIDRERLVISLKPSGIPYDDIKADDIVLLDMEGKKLDENSPNPSSDTATHIILYQNFTDIGGVTHSHSNYATAFAQAKTAIPCLGTTHADYFYGAIPVTDVIGDASIAAGYEKETGKLIVGRYICQ